ncbi:response regulator [Phototrophicus methaneseepsis]|uniref:Response regulator n=1 Tax=Phototrophicus methaneseepsis TaxID=2710758 RepID=A0A7S8EA15_9CHLR|nr:response regulator [Phototrophicus methaneseepsis]QPC82988.1 response regulator [Phototrophicus methaneseepsis]
MDKPKLLLVEDDLDLCEMVSTYFRVQNYDVVTAAFAEEGLEAAQEHQLDLIMLDVRLPDMDGFDLCRKLRQMRKTADTPIIFLTEKRSRLDKLQGLELGVVDYITKPFDIQELRLRVRNAIHRAKAPSMANPITELPEGTLVEEKITDVLKQAQWTLLIFSIEGLAPFRGRYGFVAADDVLRAVTLMIRNAVREFGTEGDFIGHLRNDRFVIITQAEDPSAIEQRVERRINQSSSYFYPLRDQERAQAAQAANLLHVESVVLTQADGPLADINALNERLAATIQAASEPSDVYFTETRPPAMPLPDPAERSDGSEPSAEKTQVITPDAPSVDDASASSASVEDVTAEDADDTTDTEPPGPATNTTPTDDTVETKAVIAQAGSTPSQESSEPEAAVTESADPTEGEASSAGPESDVVAASDAVIASDAVPESDEETT